MNKQNYSEQFYKNEYERLRRMTNRKLDNYETRFSRLVTVTLELLRSLGLSDKDILEYYRAIYDTR